MTDTISKKVLIVCGESSGDTNASQLISALKNKVVNAEFFCVGGDKCRSVGAEILFDIDQLGIIGFKSVFEKIGTIFKVRKKLIEFVRKEKPDLIITVDFPDFNLSFLSAIKSYNIPAVYFISPQIWAWRRGRVRKIKRLVRKMIVILPFEEEIYKKAGINAIYVGNPAVDRIKITESPEQFRTRYNIDSSRTIITILPGSRQNEIRDILPVVLEALKILRKKGEFQFVLAPATTVDIEKVNSAVREKGLAEDVIIAPGEAYTAAAASRVVISKSGTSTIEMALVGTPFIVVYWIKPFTYRLWKLVSRQDRIAMANIVADGDLIPELIQDKFTPENVANEVLKLLNDREARSEQLRYLKLIRENLGEGGAADRAAEAVMEYLI